MNINIRSPNLKLNLGGNQGFPPSENFVIWIITCLSVVSWRSNKKKKNLWQLIYIASKGKLAGVNSTVMQQLSEFS